MATIKQSIISFSQHQNTFLLCTIKAKDLATIAYVARRGESEEEGAVQRILNSRRIKGIKDFLLNGGIFPNTIILNWKNKDTFRVNFETIEFTPEPNMAQIIDGQHRLAGIKEAIKEDLTIGELEIPTVIATELSTSDCAEIFISINTEQKSVPKSLIYDLYGLLSYPTNRDFAVERATDIATNLNDDLLSPYCGYIKFPGSRKIHGGIHLSTFVDKLKRLVKNEGEFERFNLVTLENQTKVIKNFFDTLKTIYGKNWDSTKNPFLYASGFAASIEILGLKLLPICYSKKNFTSEIFAQLLKFDKIIEQSEVKGMSGGAAINYLKEKLDINIQERLSEETEFTI